MDDITLMMDDKDHPEHLWPTRNKIVGRFAFLIDFLALKFFLFLIVVATNRPTDQ